jgi:type 1 glutamine amidotransferase
MPLERHWRFFNTGAINMACHRFGQFPKTVCLAGLVYAMVCAGVPAIAQQKVPNGAKVLLVSGGQREHHGYRQQAHYLQKVLEDTGKFQVSITEEAAVLETDALKKYDVIILSADRRDDEHKLTERQQQALLDYASSGKGVVSLHGFCCAATDWKPEMRQMLGGVLSHVGKPDTKVKVARYTIRVAKADHPIMRGIQDFDHEDELYYYLQTVGELDALATVRCEDQDWPIAWTRSYGKGRVFVTVFGHSRWEPGSKDPQENPAFQQMIVQAIEWAANKRTRDSK